MEKFTITIQVQEYTDPEKGYDINFIVDNPDISFFVVGGILEGEAESLAEKVSALAKSDFKLRQSAMKGDLTWGQFCISNQKIQN